MAKIEHGNGVDLRGSPEKLTDNGKGSSYGSDPEVNGNVPGEKEVDKYGFSGGAQQHSSHNVSYLHSAEEIPTDVLRQRESKWLEMLNSWDKWMAKKHKKVKERCQKGIPPSLRGRAWLYLTGARLKGNKTKENSSQPGDPKWVDIIERDLHRQFPFHEMFEARGGHGQQDLFRVLKAYTLHRPEEGYCQAQAPIAAVLLMHMPAEDAFWVLVQICEKYLPGYYSSGLEAIQLDGEILYALLRRVSPVAHRHLKKHKLEPVLYMTEWFMCAFSRTLPWASVLREKLKASQGLYETMELLRAIQPQYLREGFLVQEIIELGVSEKDIEKEHFAQLRRWKETHGDLHCKSPPRMHGAKAIITAEPPSRQDLKQRPTIIVQSPLATQTDEQREQDAKESAKTNKGKQKKTTLPPVETVNPYLSPSDPSLLLKHMTVQGSKESLSSAEHDTYL
ncbi:hypothetical protein F7725_015655 [Dissostichus mawsoni]|uniref:Rab-GAP TBC domain-containing protein n=1 Tax=Dissostichus mawsoni TaxID=36200 RepID=A0A7J5YLI0_DISMA|nr:hypothetical protein F7725_015655 [Dissostichus mawsoni]